MFKLGSIFAFVFLFQFISISQVVPLTSVDTEELNEEKYTNVAITTDIDFASSTNSSNTSNSSGIGTLGLKFERPSFYGGIDFTVFAQNNNISITDSLETDLFGQNLLIPQNSTNRLSSFSIDVGAKDFKFIKSDNKRAIWDILQERIGCCLSKSK